MALVKELAGRLVTDKDAPAILMENAMELIFNDSELKRLSENIEKFSSHHAAAHIASMVLDL